MQEKDSIKQRLLERGEFGDSLPGLFDEALSVYKPLIQETESVISETETLIAQTKVWSRVCRYDSSSA